MIELEWLKIPWKLVSDRQTRLEVFGYRPEVICFLRSVGDEERYLIVSPTGDPSVWMPPQEGIEYGERPGRAAIRCACHELGLSESRLQFRRSQWIGKRVLPPERLDERDLQYSVRHVFGGPRMVGKGYYAALIWADGTQQVTPNPAEISDHAWVGGTEFFERIRTTLPDKQEIIARAWAELSLPAYGAQRDIVGQAGERT